MGRHRPPEPAATPHETVRRLMKAGKVKKKCCRSKPRCKKCPVRALERARLEAEPAQQGQPRKVGKKTGKKTGKKAGKKAA